MKVRRRVHTTMEAVQFKPSQKPWPKGLIPHSEVTPRDMSFGYVKAFGFGKVHVYAGDWLVYDGENILVIPDKIFLTEFEVVE